jgi:hypothetical protein
MQNVMQEYFINNPNLFPENLENVIISSGELPQNKLFQFIKGLLNYIWGSPSFDYETWKPYFPDKIYTFQGGLQIKWVALCIFYNMQANFEHSFPPSLSIWKIFILAGADISWECIPYIDRICWVLNLEHWVFYP